MKYSAFFLLLFCITLPIILGAQVNVDSNNDVGIGTTTPTKKLHVVGQAEINNGNSSIVIGTEAEDDNPGSLLESVVLGYQAAKSATGGGNNVFIGKQSGYSNTSGDENVFIGLFSGKLNTTGDNNIFIGDHAGEINTLGYGNLFFGSESGSGNVTGRYNSIFGYLAGASINGNDNSLFGKEAGNNLALSGTQNSFFGSLAGKSKGSGSGNSFFGYKAGDVNKTGNYNTYVGTQSGPGNGTVFSNSSAFGYLATAIGSNTIVIGNSSIISIGGYSNWTNLSDKRFKNEVREDVKGLDFIMGLRPVTYQLDLVKLDEFLGVSKSSEVPEEIQKARQEKSKIRFTGFIAQEVESTAESIGYDFSGVERPKSENDHYSLSYSTFVVPLVKAVQELKAENDALKEKLNSSVQLLSSTEEKMETLEASNQKMKDDIRYLMEKIEQLEKSN